MNSRIAATCYSLSQERLLSSARIVREIQRPRVLVPLLLVIIILGAAAIYAVRRYRDARWAREVAVPEIAQLTTGVTSTGGLYDQGKYMTAYSLAVKAEKAIPGDPALAKLWPKISYQLSLETTPPGADVYRREYDDTGSAWTLRWKDSAEKCSPAARDVYLEVRKTRVRYGLAYDPRSDPADGASR